MNEFEWCRLGDIDNGRQNLGQEMPVSLYRLMQYTLGDVISEQIGVEASQRIFRQAGFVAGKAFAVNLLNLNQEFNAFIAELQRKIKELKVGLLRIEKVDMDSLTMTLSIAEDLDCSGLPVTGDTVCVYDEGFIGGILNAYTGKIFEVTEIDCWATGDRTCRFLAKVLTDEVN